MTYIQPEIKQEDWLFREPFGHVVCFSGGMSSALVAIEVRRKFPNEPLFLVNHDIKASSENADIKRFKQEVADYVGVPITYANMPDWDTKDQFDVAVQVKAFTNPEGDALCTSRMKIRPFMDWLSVNFPTKHCVIYYGYDAHEPRRILRRSGILASIGFRSAYPRAYWPKTIYSTTEIGIQPPNTYEVFIHANCTACLKAGKQHWYVVYCTRQDLWARGKWAEDETGYSIFKGEYLSDLEPLFEAMKQAGIPATEKIPSGKFWKMVREKVPLYRAYLNQDEDAKPCECVA